MFCFRYYKTDLSRELRDFWRQYNADIFHLMIPLHRSLLVFIGGGLGANARYWLALSIQNWFKSASFPFGTFVINVTGSLVIGIMTGLLAKSLDPENARLLLVVGFLGGYTTFSTFSLDSFNLLSTKSYGIFAAYVLGSVIFALAGTWLGMTLVKAIKP